jgi:hypothetical protein
VLAASGNRGQQPIGFARRTLSYTPAFCHAAQALLFDIVSFLRPRAPVARADAKNALKSVAGRFSAFY